MILPGVVVSPFRFESAPGRPGGSRADRAGASEVQGRGLHGSSRTATRSTPLPGPLPGPGADRDGCQERRSRIYATLLLLSHNLPGGRADRDPPATAVCVALSCGSTGTRHAIARYVCVPLLGRDNRPDGAAAPGPVCGRGVARDSVCRGAPLPVRSSPPGGKIPAGSLVPMGAIRSHPITFRTAGGVRAGPPRPDPPGTAPGRRVSIRSHSIRSDQVLAGRQEGRPGVLPVPIRSPPEVLAGRTGSGLRFVPGLLHIDRQKIRRLCLNVWASPAVSPGGQPSGGDSP